MNFTQLNLMLLSQKIIVNTYYSSQSISTKILFIHIKSAKYKIILVYIISRYEELDLHLTNQLNGHHQLRFAIQPCQYFYLMFYRLIQLPGFISTASLPSSKPRRMDKTSSVTDGSTTSTTLPSLAKYNGSYPKISQTDCTSA